MTIRGTMKSSESITSWEPPEGFKMVYQGGHHNVYCNGENHIWTGGGFCGLSDPSDVKRVGKCDCLRFK